MNKVYRGRVCRERWDASLHRLGDIEGQFLEPSDEFFLHFLFSLSLSLAHFLCLSLCDFLVTLLACSKLLFRDSRRSLKCPLFLYSFILKFFGFNFMTEVAEGTLVLLF